MDYKYLKFFRKLELSIKIRIAEKILNKNPFRLAIGVYIIDEILLDNFFFVEKNAVFPIAKHRKKFVYLFDPKQLLKREILR